MKLHLKNIKGISKEKHLPGHGNHPGEVHIWTHVIHYDDPFLRQAPFMLSQDEMGRAARYHFEKDRRVYESAHVFIRKVLAHYVSLDPVALQLSPLVNTKPQLLNAPFHIHFNISHSGNRILVAIGFDSDVGIDLEKIMNDFDMDGFAEANYHANELELFRQLKGDDETLYFYTIWTRKEAWLKLTGEGINDKLRELDFSGKTNQPKFSPFGHQNVYMTTWKEGLDYVVTLASDIDRTHTLFFDSSLLINESGEDLNEAVEYGED
ncbi:MAG TPA: 4'-phosphopantetheinyl transferase superfamily protein [Bacteroidia bacterium]|nr:4'-phosphopantetheinyl transferase superfamily protein [Bacteroidia bacterium]